MTKKSPYVFPEGNTDETREIECIGCDLNDELDPSKSYKFDFVAGTVIATQGTLQSLQRQFAGRIKSEIDMNGGIKSLITEVKKGGSFKTFSKGLPARFGQVFLVMIPSSVLSKLYQENNPDSLPEDRARVATVAESIGGGLFEVASNKGALEKAGVKPGLRTLTAGYVTSLIPFALRNYLNWRAVSAAKSNVSEVKTDTSEVINPAVEPYISAAKSYNSLANPALESYISAVKSDNTYTSSVLKSYVSAAEPNNSSAVKSGGDRITLGQRFFIGVVAGAFSTPFDTLGNSSMKKAMLNARSEVPLWQTVKESISGAVMEIMREPVKHLKMMAKGGVLVRAPSTGLTAVIFSDEGSRMIGDVYRALWEKFNDLSKEQNEEKSETKIETKGETKTTMLRLQSATQLSKSHQNDLGKI